MLVGICGQMLETRTAWTAFQPLAGGVEARAPVEDDGRAVCLPDPSAEQMYCVFCRVVAHSGRLMVYYSLTGSQQSQVPPRHKA